MPASKKRTNLSKNSGSMVPTSVSSRPKPMSTSTKSKKKKKSSTKAPSSKRRSEETRPLEPDLEEDNLSDVSEDPVDNYNLSGDEIDDEPRFKYSTAELPDNSSRNTRCCLMAMCILCIIVAIVVSIVMVKVPQNKQEEADAQAPAPTPPPPTANGVGSLQERKTVIDSMCDDSRNSCKEVCEPEFDCCDPFMNEQAGCFFGNREGCLNYQRCHVANPGTIDPPSPNINVICSKSAIANDPGPCEDACLAVKCCWEDNSSCKDSNFYACTDYAICQNLRGAALEVPLPIDGLEDFCEDYVVGSLTQSEACGVACAPASCCWEDTTANCFLENFFTCLLHEPCGLLEIPEAYSFVPEPNADTAIVCSKPYRDTNGSSECEASCNRAPCCSAAPGENCFWRDPLGCLKYDGCKLLTIE